MTKPTEATTAGSSQPTPDVPQLGWSVWRIDDNGNVFVVSEQLSREDADKLVETYTARGHKQMYWVERTK